MHMNILVHSENYCIFHNDTYFLSCLPFCPNSHFSSQKFSNTVMGNLFSKKDISSNFFEIYDLRIHIFFQFMISQLKKDIY